jgi:hypothetical protein
MVQKSSVPAPRINDWWFDLRQPASEIVRSLKATRSSIPDPSSGRRRYWRRRQGEGFGERSRGFQMASALLYHCGDTIAIGNHVLKVCRK